MLRALELVTSRFGNGAVLVVAIFAALVKLPLYMFDADMGLSADVTEIFYFDAHSWPPFRLMDYSVGLCAGAWWKMSPAARTPGRYTEMRSYFMMAICVVAAMGYDRLPQPIVLVALAGGIYGVSTSGGILIRLLQSRGLVFLGSLVMPVYLMHNVVLKYARWANVDISQNSVALVLLLLCFCLAYVWQRVEKMARVIIRQIS